MKIIIINYHRTKLFTVIALFSIVLFSNSSLVKRNADYEEDNLINGLFVQNRNVFAVEMGVEGGDYDSDDNEGFDYVFDPFEYIEGTDSEKPLNTDSDNNNVEKNNDHSNASNNVKKTGTKSIIADDEASLSEYNEEKNEEKSVSTITAITKLNSVKASDHKSDFNFVAVGDWDCKDETKDTVYNILEQDPEIVLALGDLSYNGKAKCWLNIIEPIADITEIVIGNHETDSSKMLRDYMRYFGMEKQYYSFNYKSVHFIGLSTEIPYEEGSQQYEFAVQDLERASEDPSINWIVAFYHRQAYSSGGGPDDEDDFAETYHPLFDKYNVDLALQGHFHAYERSYPISFNHHDEDEPIVRDYDPSYYINPKGTIFITAGTGGAHDMKISKQKEFSAYGLDGEFGIVNIAVDNDGSVLKGSFIENNGDEDVYDEFQILKEDIVKEVKKIKKKE